MKTASVLFAFATALVFATESKAADWNSTSLTFTLNRTVDATPKLERDSPDRWIQDDARGIQAIFRYTSKEGEKREVVLVDFVITDSAEAARRQVESIVAQTKKHDSGRVTDHSKAFGSPCFETWYEIEKDRYGTRHSFAANNVAVLVTPSHYSAEIAKLISQEMNKGEQDGAGEPATRAESASEGSDKPQPELEGRSR